MRQSDQNHLDNYVRSLLGQESEVLNQAYQDSVALGLGGISLGYTERALLASLLQIFKIKKWVEVGTLTGLSALVAKAAMGADSKVWTCEKSAEHAVLARKNFANSGFADSIVLLEGDAVQMLPTIQSEGPFDGVFIDGNKAAYGSYLEWAEANVRKGGIIIGDNVLLSGAVISEELGPKNKTGQPRFNEKQIQVMRKFNQRLSDRQLYLPLFIPTSEGLFVAQKKF